LFGNLVATMVKVEPLDHDGSRQSLGRSSGKHDRDSSHSDPDRRSSSMHQASAPGAFVYATRHLVRDLFLRLGWYESSLALRIRRFLRGRMFAALTMVSLFVALFMGEIFAIAQVSTNLALDIILTTVFAIFAFEFVGLALTDTSYLFGFFFWMDLLGTVSMVFDISFMAGLNVQDRDMVNMASGSSSQQNVIVVRATRAAKLGARAGRISRVLKILRFLPFLTNNEAQDAKKIKVAKVISNQLTNGLSTRVAFLTICIVIVMPLFTMFTYPEEDRSMGAWTDLLDLNAAAYYEAWESGNTSLEDTMKLRLVSELTRLRDFYSDVSYGPFNVKFGKSSADGVFAARQDILNLNGLTDWTFSDPSRKSSSRVYTQGHMQTYFDLTVPKRQEAASSIGLICFIIIVMCCFGMVMSSSISVIALQPLERMLSVVRERCTQIFKYTDNLKDDSSSDSDEESEYDDMEHDSEFVLLEKVVGKLAAIAHLSATTQEPEVKADMNENEIMQLSWMQGAQVPAVNAGRASVAPKALGKGGLEASETDLRPPRGLNALNSMPMAVMEALDTADFNSLDLTKEVRCSVAAYLITDTNTQWSSWARSNVPEAQLWAFVTQVESNYTGNPFHNFAHAIDVEYMVYRYMDLIGADRFLSDTTQFSLLVSAIGHDVGHTGVNNQYLIETSNELAVRYNDRSPLENMHCARLFQIISAPETNLFAQIEKDLYKEMRKGMIDAILHTDVTKHNEMIKELGMLYQMNSETFDSLCPETAITSNANISLISSMLLHGADVSNPVKPWSLCRRLAYLCMDEFFAQGDLEKAAGIPVQMLNDREKVNRPNAQIGFIEFFIAPMVMEMVHLFPPLHSLAENLDENIQNWSEVWQQEANPAPEAVAKVAARVRKVADNMKILAKTAQEHQSQFGE